ncbi:MAG: RNA-dependent RNA polymerase [Fushun diaea subdola tombus-like virus 2]|nr:MAG: RNA-dependent RNA polymerase [Fushun diaea subdola tombus-like virus 2]
MHEHTIEQELKTLTNRHLFDTPEPNVESQAWKTFRKTLRDLTKKIGYVELAPARQVVEHRVAMKRRRFGKGMELYFREGVKEKHSNITMMPKLEFYDVEKIPIKEDRGIQFRNPVYNAALARHLHNIEPAIYRALVNKDGTPIVAKGYSTIERAMIMHEMAKRFKKPMFVMADHSRFDAHVNPKLLLEEHRTYLRLRNYSGELKELLKWQESSTGFSHGGIKYKVKGKRMSGDLNTALGNTLLNWAMLDSYCKDSDIDANIFLDGDDSIMCMEEQEIPSLSEYCAQFGMETVVEITDDIRKAEFCQCRVIYTKRGPVMCRNPFKVLECMTKCPRRLMTEAEQNAVLSASALGELMQSPGLPMLAPACAALHRIANCAPAFQTVDAFYSFQKRETRAVVEEVDDFARVDLEVAWGIPLGDQLAVEAYYTQQVPMDAPIRWPKQNCKIYNFEIDDDLAKLYEPPAVNRFWRDEWPELTALMLHTDADEAARARHN